MAYGDDDPLNVFGLGQGGSPVAGLGPMALPASGAIVPPPMPATMLDLAPPPSAAGGTQVASTDPAYIFSGLTKRGLSPQLAYATLGNWKQESELNADAVNPYEGAHGFDQWRLDRWDALQRYAQSIGKSPNDPDVQMDYYVKELHSHAGGAQALSAADIPTANRALKTFIGYGDTSENTRLQNAFGFAGQKMPINALAGTRHQAPSSQETQETADIAKPTGAAIDASSGGAASPDMNKMLRLMFAASLMNVKLQPVDYNPYAVMPHFTGY